MPLQDDLDWWRVYLDDAADLVVNIDTGLITLYSQINMLPNGMYKDTFNIVAGLMANVRGTLRYLVNDTWADKRLENILQEMIDTWPEGGGGDVTWKQIMRAWWDAPIGGWGWTIQFIDFMREAVWNEPMTIVNSENFMVD